MEGIHMKNKQNDAVFTILLSIVITSCTANNKPFASVSEMLFSVSVALSIFSAVETAAVTASPVCVSDAESKGLSFAVHDVITIDNRIVKTA